jgi:3',5'-cyclic AMP phosphodiesterase CpdA
LFKIIRRKDFRLLIFLGDICNLTGLSMEKALLALKRSIPPFILEEKLLSDEEYRARRDFSDMGGKFLQKGGFIHSLRTEQVRVSSKEDR